MTPRPKELNSLSRQYPWQLMKGGGEWNPRQTGSDLCSYLLDVSYPHGVCDVVFSAGLHTLQQAASSAALELAFGSRGRKDAAVCPGSRVGAQRQQRLLKDWVGPSVEAENPPGRILLLFVFPFQVFTPCRSAPLTAAT